MRSSKHSVMVSFVERHGAVKAEPRAIFSICMPWHICSDHSPPNIPWPPPARRRPCWRLSTGACSVAM